MWDQYRPEEIEQRSFELLREEMGPWQGSEEESWIVQRVIHTSADFEFKDTIYFSPNAAQTGIYALSHGAVIITDTNMALAGISKKTLSKNNGQALCYIANEEIAHESKMRGITRAVVAVEKAVREYPDAVFVIGNAPTALLRLIELSVEGKAQPKLVIGVPVGFVHVVEAKQKLIESKLPCIVTRGRKGGSTIAASIVNALLYGDQAPGVRQKSNQNAE